VNLYSKNDDEFGHRNNSEKRKKVDMHMKMYRQLLKERKKEN